ncbi:dethiobiotin synthase [Denitromonas iodatirespirans]|uniref:ATP-dependent dethiobiotin synthetase BioD n=1 Tax=Denitromonas iodatirespirans TaxID=2795389 RepID=A0A944D7V2_DENI1|nr:dethiobiotin synthase [Denitromonas iodatirespirans]MBT0960177.1 dethiobiotin synthase [Denitromonas iodatirespirans]
MPSAYFIAGTDTEIGKTFTTCALLHTARRAGLSAIGMKPVAAGAECVDGVWINEDAARLRAAGSVDPGLANLNPICLRTAVAPHIAAAAEGVTIDPARILAAFTRLQPQADLVLVEGVGGFRVPLTDGFDTADLAVALGLPVILVVGMRLGCINHALLTAEAIAARGLTLAGWVANQIDPDMACVADNLDALQRHLDVACLGHVPFMPDKDPAAVSALRLPPGG